MPPIMRASAAGHDDNDQDLDEDNDAAGGEPGGEDASDEDDDAPQVGASTAAPTAPKDVTLPSNAISQIRREERAKGKRSTLAELDAKAQDKGYDSWADLLARAPDPRRPQPAGSGPDKRELGRLRRDNADLVEKQRLHNQEVAKKDRQIAALKQQLKDQEARYSLRDHAREAGVVDADYAVELFSRRLKALPEAEQSAFDPKKFFAETLREEKPVLYKEVKVPASTAPDAKDGEQPPPPSDKKPEPPAPVDARSMSREDYHKHLAKRGIRVPGVM